jgi:hypothetical protein
MKTKKSVVFAGVMAMVCLLCTELVFAQTTSNRSYYVRADGNDNANDGLSEKSPFRTLQKAINMARVGTVRTITVIGTVRAGRYEKWINDYQASIENAGSAEILITGKPTASANEKAVISDEIIVVNSKVRFTHVQITDKNGPTVGALGIRGKSAVVTLGAGALITNCANYGVVWNDKCTLNMTDNATISNNGGGVFGGDSTLNMMDNAVISDNTSKGMGGGVRLNDQGTINMTDNAAISGNTAESGGGVCIWSGTINMTDNAVISGNTAIGTGCEGGGVFVSEGTINMTDNAVISGNTSKNSGGGVCVYHGDGIIKGGKITGNTANLNGGGVIISDGGCMIENVEISGNKAEYGAGAYIMGADLMVSGGKITGNEAKYGGGVYVKTGATYTANSVSVIGNKAIGGNDVFRQ